MGREKPKNADELQNTEETGHQNLQTVRNGSSERLRTATQGIEMDDSDPEPIGNSVTYGSREGLLWGAQDGRVMGSSKALDGSFLTLGVCVNTEAGSKNNVGALNAQLNTSHGESGYGSSVPPGFETQGRYSSINENAVGSSSLKHDFGGHPSIVQNASDSSKVTAFPGSALSVDGAVGLPSTTQNASSPQMLPIPQSRVPYPFLTQGHQKFGAGYANVVPNPGESSNGENFGGCPSVVHNASEPSNMTTFPGSAHSVDTAAGHPSTIQNASPLQMLPNPQSRVPYPFLTQGHQKFGAGYVNVVPNPGASSNGENLGGRPSVVHNASESSNMTTFPGSAHSVDTAVGHPSTMQNASPLQIISNPQSRVPYPFLTQGHQKFGAGFGNIGPYRGFHAISGASSNGNNFGGHPSVVQNANESSNMSAFPGSGHSVDTAVGHPSTIQNESPLQMLPNPQSHVPYPFLIQGHQKFGAGFTNVVPNRGFHGISGASSNRENFGWRSTIVHSASKSSNLTAIPRSAQSVDTAVGLPSTMQNAIPPQMLPVTQRHVPYPYLTQGHQNFGSGSANIVPNRGFRGTSSFQENLISHSRLPPNQSIHALSGISPLPVQEQQRLTLLPSLSSVTSDQQQSHNKVSIPILLQGTPVAPVVGNIESSGSQSGFHNNTVQASNNHVPTSGGNGPAIPSNCLSGSSLKRGAAQPPPTIPQVQKKRATNCSPYPSVAHPISSVPPVRVTTPPIRATTIPASAMTIQSPHIKRQAKDPFQPSGYNCFLCKRDLSYVPEGPISPSAARPNVAVLPCGHSFHDLCLQRVTPEDQANDPPCIPCAVGED